MHAQSLVLAPKTPQNKLLSESLEIPRSQVFDKTSRRRKLRETLDDPTAVFKPSWRYLVGFNFLQLVRQEVIGDILDRKALRG